MNKLKTLKEIFEEVRPLDSKLDKRTKCNLRSKIWKEDHPDYIHKYRKSHRVEIAKQKRERYYNHKLKYSQSKGNPDREERSHSHNSDHNH